MLLSLSNIHKAPKISLLVCVPAILTFRVKHCPYKMDLFKAKFSAVPNPYCKERE